MPLRRLPANETASQRHVGKLVQLRNRIGIAADFAMKELFSFPGVLPPTPEAAPKLGYIRIGR